MGEGHALARGVTAGPGVTNAVSAIASSRESHSPVLVLGGRAPAMRWRQGSLQEIGHVPFIAPLVKFAATPDDTSEIPELLQRAIRSALTPHTGSAFLDFPLDHVFMEADAQALQPLSQPILGPAADAAQLDRAAALLREAERPVILAGTGLYWGRGEQQLKELAEQLGVPAFLNGLGRGCLPADHELVFVDRANARTFRTYWLGCSV
jgi:acetolactate synthase I/II/III large subunit